MRWRWLLPLILNVSLAPAAPTVTSAGDNWVLENAALKVTVNAAAGTLQVLDKASGYLWRGPQGAAPAATVLAVPPAPAVTVDGDGGDWPAGAASLSLLPALLAEGQRPQTAADLQGDVRVGWDGRGLYLWAKVADEKLVLNSAAEAQWWENDSLEFWLGHVQYAVRMGEWGANLWASNGVTTGGRAAWKRTADGYSVEVFMPAAMLGLAGKPAPGARFPLAVGLNDCDGSGRQTQFYHPAGWVHSNASTFAAATLVSAGGQVPPPSGPARPALTPATSAPRGALAFTTTVRTAGRDLPVAVTLALEGDKPDLVITTDTPDRSAKVDRFTVLNPLVLDRPHGRALCAAYCDGIGVRTDDMSWRGRRWATWGVDMPWVGLTDGQIGYLLQWDLPVSCDNGEAQLDAVSTGQQSLLAPTPYHVNIKGQFAQPRVHRYSFCATGGHVTICKRYRDYLKAHGLLVTQFEKLKRKPHLARLAGAPDIWGRADLKFCQEAKAAGIDRLMVNSASSKADMEAIKALGYLISVYDNYEDAFEGDQGKYGDFKTETDSRVNADGSLMKAWITHETPPKQFMKRCTELFVQVASKWIPLDLEKAPYNARFLDVTTACSLYECFSPTHGQDRTADRLARTRLAQYVGDKLNLVLGGEHGRWWGAATFNYWEGMQSGGFYSWPAGYVGEKIPQTREEIGKQYLEWGLGETNRYPLWELVFHDCVVSTWYWGDSTGHLRVAAPELGHKQDAFNILYGTVPLYWVNQPYSYKWSDPEQRERLLESYRVTCKLHEVVGFQEMRSHEFVTEDRAVQKTTFADGTQVWVNFGEQPYALSLRGRGLPTPTPLPSASLSGRGVSPRPSAPPAVVGARRPSPLERGTPSVVLPQFGFYVKGPKIEQSRVLRGDKPATSIRTASYAFAEGNAPGLLETDNASGVTVRKDGVGRLRVNAKPGTAWVRLNWKQLCPDAGKGNWRVAPLNAQGEAMSLTTVVKPAGDLLTVKPTVGSAGLLLVGPAALAGKAEIALAATGPLVTPPAAQQGKPLTVNATVRNYGGKPATNLLVTARWGTYPVGPTIASRRVTIKPYASLPVQLTLDTTRCDGQRRVTVTVIDDIRVAEYCDRDNALSTEVTLVPNWSLWDTRVDLKLTNRGEAVTRPLGRLALDPAAERAKLGRPGPLDPDSLRVAFGDVTLDAQLLPGAQGPELVFVWPGQLDPGLTLPCQLYLDGGRRHSVTARGHWDAAANTYQGPFYRVQFDQGAIVKVTLTQSDLPLLSYLQTSSKDTGWTIENGEVEEFKLVADGPVVTIVEVKKKLAGNHSYHKRYEFYPDFFTVTVLSPERYGTMSRAHYLAAGQIEDDIGTKAVIDGKGDGENFYGKNPKPRWYATWNAREWALNAVAVTPHDSITYWDAGNMAAVGFNTGLKTPATVAYFVHPGPLLPGWDPRHQAEADYQRAKAKVEVAR